MNSNLMLKVKNLKVNLRLKNPIVNKISFSVNLKEVHALIGENGAGKTAIIKSIVNSYVNYTGEIQINNSNSKATNSKSILGYVPSVIDFPKHITTYKYLTLLGKISKLTPTLIDKRVEKFLSIFKIEHLKNQKPYNFSLGQKRKISFIQALIHNPNFIILDDPLANLDFNSKLDIINILKQLKNQGKTILISSNNLEDIDMLVDSVTYIKEGKIIYSGKKDQKLETYFTSQYIKQNNQENVTNESK
ncbi:ATP-binding cassette domain-containing protein [Mycoplasma sp. 1654_15]|uniref:ATP-binding cassette domain-containing protein n=1 Tax=Mycoplasma sp. 1654_15 TaxID=2725994 RepID=UPI00144A2109|nr:ABC transporter ATP-binding protein [Mycoplasma sp. 1654_15]QJB70941.1 ABC transporter ATP-binding protein [Mycoplasma sp. 1654_15]